MQPSERVRAALRMEPVDRPPVGLWGHDHLAEWEPERLAAVTVERRRRFGWDFVKFQPRATCFAEAFGSLYRPSGDPLRGPVLARPAVIGAGDWEALPTGAADAPPLAEQVSALAAVARDLGPAVPILQTVFSPLTVAGYLVGEEPERILREVRSRPEEMGASLDRIAGALAEFAVRSVEAGAAGVFFAVSGYASADRMTREEYEAFVLPHDLRVVRALPTGAWFNVAHLCGPSIHLDVATALGLHAVSWSVHERGNPSLPDARDRTRLAVMGGLDQRGTLVSGPPDAVRAEAASAVEATGSRGLLLAPGCSVPPEAPEENLRAALSALPPAG